MARIAFVSHPLLAASAWLIAATGCGTPASDLEEEVTVEAPLAARVEYRGPRDEFEGDLAELARSADLVFEGVVVGRTYRESQAGRGLEGGLPHTFVTYDIHRIFKGQTAGDSITLRFEGGMHADGRRFYNNPDYPLFDLGDRDLLYVVGNGELSCPLVGCAAGRFRRIDGRTLAEDGRAFFVRGHTLRQGDVYDAEEIREHGTIGDRGFSRVRRGPEPMERETELRATGHAPVDDARIAELAEASVHRAHARSELEAIGTTPSLSGARPFSIEDRRATPTVTRVAPPDDAPEIDRRPVRHTRGTPGSRFLSR